MTCSPTPAAAHAARFTQYSSHGTVTTWPLTFWPSGQTGWLMWRISAATDRMRHMHQAATTAVGAACRILNYINPLTLYKVVAEYLPLNSTVTRMGSGYDTATIDS